MVTVQKPSLSRTMSKDPVPRPFAALPAGGVSNRTFCAVGADTQKVTRPSEWTRGYCAPRTLLAAGFKSPVSPQQAAADRAKRIQAIRLKRLMAFPISVSVHAARHSSTTRVQLFCVVPRHQIRQTVGDALFGASWLQTRAPDLERIAAERSIIGNVARIRAAMGEHYHDRIGHWSLLLLSLGNQSVDFGIAACQGNIPHSQPPPPYPP